MSNCTRPDCVRCHTKTDIYKGSDLDFLKETLYNLIDFIRWQELGYMIVSLTIFCIWLGWWGIIPFLALDYLLHMEGGTVGDAFNEYPKEEFPPNTCSAGIKDCNVCNNTYDHDFNVKYYKGLKWWEKML